MKTNHAIELAGSAAALAALFGITPSAVSQWGDEIPELRQYQLKKMKPKWFRNRPTAPQPTTSAMEAA